MQYGRIGCFQCLVRHKNRYLSSLSRLPAVIGNSTMDLTWLWQPLQMYCERQDDRFFAEPLNLFSNLGFFIVWYRIYYRLSRNKIVLSVRQRALHHMIATIGVGSSAFHSMPNRLTEAIDVIPITIYLVLYLVYVWSDRRIIGLANSQCMMSVFFIGSLLGVLSPSSWANGSLPYLGGFTLFDLARANGREEI